MSESPDEVSYAVPPNTNERAEARTPGVVRVNWDALERPLTHGVRDTHCEDMYNQLLMDKADTQKKYLQKWDELEEEKKKARDTLWQKDSEIKHLKDKIALLTRELDRAHQREMARIQSKRFSSAVSSVEPPYKRRNPFTMLSSRGRGAEEGLGTWVEREKEEEDSFS